MDFKLTTEQRELQETARKFAQNEMPAIAAECERTANPVPDDMRLKMGDMGFLGLNIPSEYGGSDIGKVEALLVLEEFSKISPAVAFPIFEAACGPTQTILYHGPEWMKKEILPKVCSGEMMI